MDRDLVLVTADCWRHDTLERMPQLAGLTGNYDRREAFCQAAATRGAFPALLSGSYYPTVYDGMATVHPTVRPIQEVLSDAGYATGAVVGSNPFLNAWADGFDYFWNDGLDAAANGGSESGTDGGEHGDGSRLQDAVATLRHGANYLRLQSRAPAPQVARRAARWYESRDRPRFLWVHLMDLHAPFFPGLRRGIEEGLLDVYRSHLQFRRDPEELTDEEFETLERCYWRCVEYFDDHVGRIFEFVDDDASVVLVGDHGEEFDHDGYQHARLYDECVRVPLLTSPDLADAFGDADLVQQLDIPATLLSALDLDVPDGWEGAPVGSRDPYPMFSLNHSQHFEAVYAAARGRRYKVVKTFDEAMTRRSVEAYDLVEDPGETVDVYGDRRGRGSRSAPADRDGRNGEASGDRGEVALDGRTEVAALEDALDRFLEREEIRNNVLETEEDVSAEIEDRLEALGYK